MISYSRETVQCFAYKTKCRIGDTFYSYFPVIPMRLFHCEVFKIEITKDDIIYWYTANEVGNLRNWDSYAHSVSDDKFDNMLFKTEKEALDALKHFVEENPVASKFYKFEVDEKTGRWYQI